MKKMKHFYGVSLLAAVCLAACTPEDEFTRSNGQMGSLGFSVSVADDNGGSDTRSNTYVVETFVVGNDTLCLTCTETDMCDSAPEVEETSATRGTPIYTSTGTGTSLLTSPLYNLESVYASFNVTGKKVASDGTLSDFYWNYTDTPPTETYMGDDPTEAYIDMPYKFDSYVAKNTSEWEYWSPVGTEAEKFYWWRDKKHDDLNYKLSFYAYSPTPDVAEPYKWSPTMAYDKNGKMTFSYSVPTGGTGTYSGKDAEVQPDILVGSTLPQVRDDLDKVTISGVDHYKVDLKFFHALSGVRFCIAKPSAVSGSEEDDLTGYTIESITLDKLRPSGTCTLSYPTGKTPLECVSSQVISWGSYGAGNGTYTQTFDHTIADGKTGGEMAYGTTTSQTFMLLPQTLGESGTNSPNSEVSIVLKDKAGVTQVLKVQKLKGSKGASGSSPSAWLPGKMYTYKLATKQKDVTVSIDDTPTTVSATERTKSGLKIKNTGTTAAYIRVAAVANWYKGETNFTTPYSATQLATDLASLNVGTGKPWYKGADGFYYYRNPLLGGKTITGTNNLFSTITFAGTPPEDTGWHLEVNLVVQAVRTNDVEAAWGTGIISTAGLTITPSTTDL